MSLCIIVSLSGLPEFEVWWDSFFYYDILSLITFTTSAVPNVSSEAATNVGSFSVSTQCIGIAFVGIVSGTLVNFYIHQNTENCKTGFKLTTLLG